MEWWGTATGMAGGKDGPSHRRQRWCRSVARLAAALVMAGSTIGRLASGGWWAAHIQQAALLADTVLPFWPNLLECDPLVVLCDSSLGLTFPEICHETKCACKIRYVWIAHVPPLLCRCLAEVTILLLSPACRVDIPTCVCLGRKPGNP